MSLESAFASPPAKRRYVRNLFATIADRYDLITGLLSYGQDRRWKSRLAALSGLSGLQPDGSERPARNELLRLAFPRRVYTQSHVDYIAEVLAYVRRRAGAIRGMRIVDQPTALRHFTARLVPAHGGLYAD